MLDRDNGGHAVADVSAGKIRILFLQHANLAGVHVHDCRKGRLETGQMGTALRVVDVVAKAKDVLMEFVHILECHLNLNAVRLTLEADRITDRLLLLIQLTDKAGDAIRLVKGDLLRCLAAQVGKVDRQKRIQVGRLMQPGLQLGR